MYFYFLCILLYVIFFIYINSINCLTKINKDTSYISFTFRKKKIAKVFRPLCSNNLSKNNLEEIKKKLEDIGIFQKDIEEVFVKGSGKGGQKVNKTNNCVMIKYNDNLHKIIIKCHKYRYDKKCLQKNRIYARKLLYNRIFSIKDKIEKEISYQIEKEKRKTLKLTEKEKNASINYKKRKSAIKKDRQKNFKYDDII
ncbi:peptide chain release factor 2, putative [Plasmodium gallinaceum]|uniref:Peptide chain release factor 2, putative n=1 Tax=Plasmodium gallinaceum TaxID=5849 RepID=A0A1J1H016_PLAGA|nr:peptide chain release factor 2, putative [Plasmodium gallinaceum]CRG98168.1 peptide chain release factor 2, putative [Plasmodium gallinaceum]